MKELAANYQGWAGERSWYTHDRHLTISAVFRSGSHFGLIWPVRPWPQAAGGWGASVTTWLEAGEQMTSLAADVRAFLAKEDR